MNAVTFDTKLTSSTLFPCGTRRSTPPLLAHHRRGTGSVIVTERRNAHTSLKVIVGLSREAMRAETVRTVILHTTDGVRPTSIWKAAGTFAHWCSAMIGKASSSWGTV